MNERYQARGISLTRFTPAGRIKHGEKEFEIKVAFSNYAIICLRSPVLKHGVAYLPDRQQVKRQDYIWYKLRVNVYTTDPGYK